MKDSPASPDEVAEQKDETENRSGPEPKMKINFHSHPYHVAKQDMILKPHKKTPFPYGKTKSQERKRKNMSVILIEK